MKRLPRKLAFFLTLSWLKIKCSIYLYLYGCDGISIILERIPQPFIIPLLKKYGATIGNDTRILHGIIFHGLNNKQGIFNNLVLGKNVYIGRNVLIDLTCKVSIDDDSALGAGSQVWTHAGNYTYGFSDYYEDRKPVRLGKAVLCWSRVLITPGVVIGDYVLVAAGSVVIHDIESKVLVGGVPARFIRNRTI